MNLPRHAAFYLYGIGVLSLLQVALGANLVVLAAIDIVSLAGLYPITRKTFDPNDVMYFSLCLYYGTFSLILKTLVLQPVQRNLEVPYLTSAYLLAGFGMLTVSYRVVDLVMTRHYPQTRLRRWTLFERTYANPAFLTRFTMPFLLISLAFVAVVAMNSHSTQELATGMADSGGLASLASLNPVLQLALAMQLSLLTRRGRMIDRVLIITTFALAMGLSILNDQKSLTFQIAVTAAAHTIAYRIRFQPRFIVMGAVAAILAFFYISPVIHIERDMQVEKADRVTETVRILQETAFNPIELLNLQANLNARTNDRSLAADNNYLAPESSFSDRFMMLMPIDLMARTTGRDPMGIDAFLTEVVKASLPKFVVGEHDYALLTDQMAWRYSIRENNIVSRPTLGILGSSYGTAGPLGLLLLAPLITLIVFAVNKLVCNGSLWDNPWAVFIAASVFFNGEGDITLLLNLIRGFAPLIVIAWGLIVLDGLLTKSGGGRTWRNLTS